MASEMTDFKILVLHGKGDNEANFARRLSPLRQKLNPSGKNVLWDFVSAPCELGEESYAWWTLPPGECIFFFFVCVDTRNVYALHVLFFGRYVSF
jgi:hypothetical protein